MDEGRLLEIRFSQRGGGRFLRGFTLIELLMVVAIIALLMAILMPAVNLAKRQTQAVVCRSNLRQWGLIFSAYTAENDGYFHEGWDASPPSQAGYFRQWTEVMRPWSGPSSDFWCCPRATRPMSDGELATGYTFRAWGVYKGGWFVEWWQL